MVDFIMAKIVVTGADGFIGSHLTERLVRDGHVVRAFALYNSFNSAGWLENVSDEIKGEFEIYFGDIRDPFSVKRALSDSSAVCHLAALIAIPYSYHAPASYVDTNISGTLNILQAALELGLDKVIHTSTSEVYGTARTVPITEEHPLQGQSPYSASKIAADQLAYSFYASFDLPAIILRPFNTYGPRQSARAVIPTIISQVAAGMKEIRLGALSPTRNFNFVEDTVAAYCNLLAGEGGFGEVFNAGNDHEISIGDTARTIFDIMGRDVSILSDEQRLRPEKSEVERLAADSSRLREHFGWSPAFAGDQGFREGLARTIAWFTDPENLAKYKPGQYTV